MDINAYYTLIRTTEDMLVRTDGTGLICDSANAKIFGRIRTCFIYRRIIDWGFIVYTPWIHQLKLQPKF